MEHIIREHLGGRPKRKRGSQQDNDEEEGVEAGRGLLDFTDGGVLANLRAMAEAAKVGLSSSEEVSQVCWGCKCVCRGSLCVPWS